MEAYPISMATQVNQVLTVQVKQVNASEVDKQAAVLSKPVKD